MMKRQGVGHKKTVGNSPTRTPPRKIRPQLLGRMHTLLNPGVKLLANVPGLYYFPKPSDQLSWSTLTRSITVFLRPVFGLFWPAHIAPADRADPEAPTLS